MAATKVQIEKGRAVALITFLGWKNAGKWGVQKLTERLSEVKTVFDPGIEVEDAQIAEDLAMVLASIDEGAEFEVTDDDPGVAPGGGGGGGGDEEQFFADADAEAKNPKPKKAARKPKPKKDDDGQPKRPGVIVAIVGLLEAATEKSPITKKDAVEKLSGLFPDRDPEGMGRTFTIQTGRLKKEKGFDVRKNDEGYWIET